MHCYNTGDKIKTWKWMIFPGTKEYLKFQVKKINDGPSKHPSMFSNITQSSLSNKGHVSLPNINTLNLANNDIVKLESGFTFYGELSIVNI